MKRVALLMLLAGTVRAQIPSTYADLYSTLQQNLTDWQNKINILCAGCPAYPWFGAGQLFSANSNNGPNMLTTANYMTTIDGEILMHKAMGAQAIAVEVSFPMLYPPFFTGQATTYAQWSGFYSTIARHIRSQGLQVIVESQSMIPFGIGAGWSGLPVFYAGFTTFGAYATARAQAVANVAAVLNPDYFIVQEEPDTESTQTGQLITNVSNAVAMLNGNVSAARGTLGFTGKVGAGFGTWLQQYAAFTNAYTQQDCGSCVASKLDFLDIHLFPINENASCSGCPIACVPCANPDFARTNAMNIVAMASTATNFAGTPLQMTMSQGWLRKVRDTEWPSSTVLDGLYSSGSVQEARDGYSFWAASQSGTLLDQSWLSTVESLANYAHFMWLCPFNTQNWSAYIPWSAATAINGEGAVNPVNTPSKVYNIEISTAGPARTNASYTPMAQAWHDSLMPSDTAAPTAPSGLTATARSASAVSLNWTQSTDNVGVAGYQIWRNGVEIATDLAPPYQDSGLTPVTAYTYQLYAFDLAGNLSGSASVSITTPRDLTPPSVPIGLVIQSVSSSQVTLAWTASTDSDSPIAGYNVYRNGTQIGTTTTTSYQDTGLAPVATYSYTVSAYDPSKNTSAQSAPISVTTLDITPPSVPAGVVTQAISSTQINLSWAVSTDPDSPVAGYNIYRNGTNVGTSTSTSYQDTGLMPSTSYSYTVSAFDPSNNTSAQSVPVSATTLVDTTPPSVPGNLIAQAVSPNQINLAWTPSIDPDSPVAGYIVFRNGSNIGTVAGTSFMDTSLAPSTTYTYSVSAYDPAGNNSAQCAAVSATTLPPPNQPAAIISANLATFTVGTAGSFTIMSTGYPIPALSETGALPSGLTFTNNGDGTATLTGAPAVGSGAAYSLALTAVNGVGSPATQTFALTVNESAAIISGNITTFTVGTAGSFTINTSGFPAPAITETGSLPAGVSFLDNGNGTATLSGTPQAGAPGTYTLTLTAGNGIGASATQTFTLTVNQGAAIISGSMTTFTVGTAGSFTIMAAGSPTPALSQSGALPAGVAFADNGDGTATLSGTPSRGTGGSYNLTVTAANGVGTAATQSFTLFINEGAAITSANLATFTVGAAGSFTVTSTGSPTSAISETGALPAGVTLVDNGNGTAILSGTPAAGAAGNYNVTVSAGNEVGAPAMQSFTLLVNQAAAITSANLSAFTLGTAGSFTITSTGFPTPAITQTGMLPAGVTFLDNGDGTASLTGTPVAGTTGTYNLSLTATNGVAQPAVQSFTLVVTQQVTITSPNLTTFTTGIPASFTVTTTGSPIPALSESGSLPPGVSFVDNGNGTATLSGTPAAAGTYNLTVTASNGVGAAAIQSFMLIVTQGAAITSPNASAFTVGVTGVFTVATVGFPTPDIGETGALPAGVTFMNNGNGTATLGGIPLAGAGGAYSFSLIAGNGVGGPVTQRFTLIVNQSAAILSAASANFTVGVAGSFTIMSTGFPSPALTQSGTLPAGLSFIDNGDGTATLSGTPATGAGGTYILTLTAANGIGIAASQTFTLTIEENSAIVSGSITTFTVGIAGSFTIMTSGFPTPPIAESAALPAGVTFIDNGDGTATLSGIPATGTAGTYSLTLTANNGVGVAATQTFTLMVNQTAAILSGSMTTLTVGTAGSFTILATGLPVPAISQNGTLPAGVTFADNGDGTAALNGTPAAAAGGIYNLTLTAANGVGMAATQSFTLMINEGAAITTGNMAAFTVGAAGSFTVNTTGSPTPAITETGALPAGVTLLDNGNGTATLSVTPAPGAPGIYNFTLTASNGVGTPAMQSFTLLLDQPPAITSANVTTFLMGTAGSFTLTATGFPAPAITESGTLPAGVTFVDNSNGTATLAGTPAAGTAGTYNFLVTATNQVGSAAAQAFTLTVDQRPVITSSNLAAFTVGTAQAFTITATGFPAPTISISGALPAGVNFIDNGNGTATLSGTPMTGAGGTYNLTLLASNGVASPATQLFTLTVNQAAFVTSANVATFTSGIIGSFTIIATGFPTPAITETGALPSGVALADNGNGTATLSGTPAVAGVYNVTITAANGVGAASIQSFTLMVNQVAAILSGNTATFTVGVAGSFTVMSTGFPIPVIGESGALPAGLSFIDNGNGTATLSGAPAASAAGAYPLTITAGNGVGVTAQQTFTLTVNQPSAILSGAMTVFTVGTAGAFTILTAGSPFPTITQAGTLPAGVAFVDNGNGTATLSGIPAPGAGGVYPLIFTAVNGVGAVATQSFTLTVNQSVAITSGSMTTFTVGTAGSFTIMTTGSPTAAITQSGSLPAGVSFADNGNGTATLHGTPASGTTGVYNFTLTATNGVGTPAMQSFTLLINQAPGITSLNLATFTVGSAGSFLVTTAGSPTPAITETGSLPLGVTFLDNANGTATLAGTPAPGTAATYSMTITAKNGVGIPAMQSFTLTIVRPSTTVSLTSSVNPSAPGQSINLTARVTYTASGTPSGTVTFYDGAAALGTAMLAGNSAVLATSSLTSGSHSLSAVYSGDGSFSGSASAVLMQFVNFATVTTVSSNINPSTYGQPVTLTAAVTSSGGVPSGTVTFQFGATVLGSSTLNGGVASLSTSALPAGSYIISATYAGVSQYVGSSGSFTQVVNKAAATVSITAASPNPSTYGQPVTFTAAITATAGTATGTVLFKYTVGTTGQSLGSSTIVSGKATYTTTALQLPAGTDSIVAAYQGDLNHSMASSPAFAQTVSKAATSTTLSASTNKASVNQPVTFTAGVTSKAATPAGSITFTDTTTSAVLGTVALSSSGTATLVAGFSTTGNHTIKASYTSTANFSGSTSSGVSVKVQ